MSQSPSTSKAGVEHREIASGEAGQRLDNYLMRQLKGVPRSRIYRLLRKGEVRVNGRRSKPDQRLEPGDRVRLPPVARGTPRPLEEQPLPQGLAQTLSGAVLLEDQDLLVLNKPAGLPVHGGSGVAVGVIEAMRRLRPQEPFLELAHRLDRETSGCLVLARNRPALKAFHACLREGGVDKTYLALVAGAWRGGPRRVQQGLTRNARCGQMRLVQVDEEGRDADSLFTPLAHYGGATWMEVKIGTGRTHQIRVHAAHEGHPVAGDRHYGDFAFNRRLRRLGLRRLFLHARSLSFTLPSSGRSYDVEAPLDPDLARVLERLDGPEHP
ncbi:RluA family pseudouridine synthase [Ectothiorhodospira mobilis]|uniref:RluA family pseudouridine synthase n=1 Tax=Ectothiorhodospira mobilis TaxID=195064 RepID=UPI001902DE6D|nr:RluA family pseudouridine synthase [Ectothiorhodospira mobilis]MBK1690722.1 23S rRNA pseudouridine(955/2504/2580) synthase [Ectothiorhodospira mobilis]